MRKLIGLIFALSLSACGSSSPGNPCPYAGATGTCETATERTNGSGGLCSTSVSAGELERECNTWDSAFRGCWIACVEKATSCSAAMACERACYCCGRPEGQLGC